MGATRQATIVVPPQRSSSGAGSARAQTARATGDRRPRYLRWLLPRSCACSVPLTGMQQAELKFIAYH